MRAYSFGRSMSTGISSQNGRTHLFSFSVDAILFFGLSVHRRTTFNWNENKITSITCRYQSKRTDRKCSDGHMEHQRQQRHSKRHACVRESVRSFTYANVVCMCASVIVAVVYYTNLDIVCAPDPHSRTQNKIRNLFFYPNNSVDLFMDKS